MNGERPATVAVIGAGVAGLTCARELAQAGLDVRVFEKSRGKGGRCATRRVDGLRFDTGAQYLTPEGQVFRELVGRWEGSGVVARWNARFGSSRRGTVRPLGEEKPRYVGVPGMSSLAGALAGDLAIEFRRHVTELRRLERGWEIGFDEPSSRAQAAWVVLALPAPQAAELTASCCPGLHEPLASVAMTPCLAGMLRFEEPLPVALDAVFFEDHALVYAARESSKPGRPAEECWVVHAGNEFSSKKLEASPASFARRLCDGLTDGLGIAPAVPRIVLGHAWRYASVRGPLGETSLLSVEERIGACGDWAGRSKVETAFDSGRDLAARISRAALG